MYELPWDWAGNTVENSLTWALCLQICQNHLLNIKKYTVSTEIARKFPQDMASNMPLYLCLFRVASYPVTADYRRRWVCLCRIGLLHPQWLDQWCAVWQESPHPLRCPKSTSNLPDKPEDSSWSLSDLYVRTASQRTHSQSLNREQALLSEQ